MDEEVVGGPRPQLDRLVEMYLALRARKTALKNKFDEDVATLEEAMDKIEKHFLGVMMQQGLESLPTLVGTPYKSKQVSITVADKPSYMAWLLADPERLGEYLDVKANKTAVQAYIAEHKDLPPGLNYREEVVVNVRKA